MTSEKLFSMASFQPIWGSTDVCQRSENRPGLIFRPHAVLTPQCGNRQRLSSWTRGVEAASEHAHQLVLVLFAALPWDRECFLIWTQFYNWIINRHQGLIKQQFHFLRWTYPKDCPSASYLTVWCLSQKLFHFFMVHCKTEFIWRVTWPIFQIVHELSRWHSGWTLNPFPLKRLKHDKGLNFYCHIFPTFEFWYIDNWRKDDGQTNITICPKHKPRPIMFHIPRV